MAVSLSQTTLFMATGLILLLGVATWLLRSLRSGPLSPVPGPWLNAVSNLPFLYAIWCGQEAEYVNNLHQQYGSIVRVGPDTVTVIGTADTWRRVHGHGSRRQTAFAKDMVFFVSPVAPPDQAPGPITASGDYHSTIRKVVSPAFGDLAMTKYEPKIQEWADLLCEVMSEKMSTDQAVDMVKLFNCATFDIFADYCFGESLHILENREYSYWVKLIFSSLKAGTRMRAINYMSDFSRNLLVAITSRVPYVKKLTADYRGYVAEQVEKCMTRGATDSIVWSRVKAHGSFSSEQQYSIAGEMLLAGTETTATVLSGALYYLTQHSAWLDTLTMDLRLRHSSIKDLTLSSLQANDVLNAVLKETMRMYPAVPIGVPRLTPAGGATLCGYHLPEKTRVSIPHTATYRSKSNFKHPDDFRPERWLGDVEFANDNFDAFQPFHVGPRNCLGQNFTWHEMRILLAAVLLTFDISLAPESRTWRSQKTFLVWEKKPLLMYAKQRNC